MMVKAEWTGSFPCMCHGEWKLEVNGKDVSDLIPDELKHSEMNTFGEYWSWSFGEDYSEEWESYENGLQRDEWIAENKHWLDNITTEIEIQYAIYEAISEEDWRHGSCGGCI